MGNDIAHLLTPVTEPKKSIIALNGFAKKWSEDTSMNELSTRSLEGYNQKSEITSVYCCIH